MCCMKINSVFGTPHAITESDKWAVISLRGHTVYNVPQEKSWCSYTCRHKGQMCQRAVSVLWIQLPPRAFMPILLPSMFELWVKHLSIWALNYTTADTNQEVRHTVAQIRVPATSTFCGFQSPLWLNHIDINMKESVAHLRRRMTDQVKERFELPSSHMS